MSEKSVGLIKLECQECHSKFMYRLTGSQNRKKFCTVCAKNRLYENKKKFDERRRHDDVERTRRSGRRKALYTLDDHEINPLKIIEKAMKMEI